MAEELGDEDRVVTAGQFGQPERQDGRELQDFEMPEDLVLAPGDLQRLLLERDQAVLVLDEPDKVPRRADRQLAKVGAPRRP